VSAERDLAAFVQRVYGERIEFDVLRNGKPVGEHITAFDIENDVVRAVSTMHLKVSMFFVPVYSFSYTSESTWVDGRLARIDARTVDGDKQRRTFAVRRAEVLEITHAGERVTTAPETLPTEHWNPAVLARSEVLNTITGRINAIRIQACREDSALVAAAAPDGRCYEYRGDLDVRVWYDADGRWVGLAFQGSDDSEITYLPRPRGTDAA
jgi:hypothetical protein